MKNLITILMLGLLPISVFAQDNGNDFNLIWTDTEEIVGGSVGYYRGHSDVNTAERLLVVDDYDGNGFKEIVGWDHIDEHYFVIEAQGDDSFGLKRFFSFFPFFIDLNDDGVQEAINLDLESDPDSVVIQLVNYDAALDSFVIGRDLGKFVKLASEYLQEFHVVKDDFDDDPNSEVVIYSYDRWANPYGGVATHLVVFELTGNDVATAGINIEHLETISTARFKVPATITSADLDNDGQREMVLVSEERKRIFIYESQGEDQYGFVFETNRYGRDALHTFVSLTYVQDLDGDGLDDVWYSGSHGTVYVIPGRGSYDSTFTYENSARVMNIQGATQVMGGSVGDCDADGKPNMYWWEHTTESIFEIEYQGGDLRDSTNFIYTRIHQGDLSDSFQPHFHGMNIGGLRYGTLDLDNDGKRDFVMTVDRIGDWPRLLIFESVHSYTTDVEERVRGDRGPIEYALLSGYPNPTESRTTLEYELRAPSPVTLNVYNVLGQLVRKLEKGPRVAGRYRVALDTRNLPAGVYFVRLTTNFGQKTMKLLVTK